MPSIAPPAPRESLLVFSDVHLGSDLNDCTQNITKRSASIDEDLVQFLAHYRREQPRGSRWRIVIAGDFIDFIGMAIAAPAELPTAPNAEEREHGLGNAADHARLKLSRVAVRHADVFAELARFVADGHALTIVHGNHDIEFHWDGVKDDFRALLESHAKKEDAALDVAAFHERIDFNPWFFYREGVAYIEHGHQYDPFCSTDHIMTPVSPLDPRRMTRGFTDVLLRYVVKPTRGMREHGHEHTGMLHYLSFAFRLGLGEILRLGSRFVVAIKELFRLRRMYFSEAAKVLRAEHEKRVALLAQAKRISIDRLKALLSLQAPPLTRSVRGIMASLLLDRIALAFASLLALSVFAVVGVFHGHALYGVLVVLIAWALFHRYLIAQRTVDPAEQLVIKASQLAKLFPAAFVVMGHTHTPVNMAAGEATYINLGSWAEDEATSDDPPEWGALRATRTHLVIHPQDEKAEASLFRWDASKGPLNFDA